MHRSAYGSYCNDSSGSSLVDFEFDPATEAASFDHRKSLSRIQSSHPYYKGRLFTVQAIRIQRRNRPQSTLSGHCAYEQINRFGPMAISLESVVSWFVEYPRGAAQAIGAEGRRFGRAKSDAPLKDCF